MADLLPQEDDSPRLSPHTLAALQEFLATQHQEAPPPPHPHNGAASPFDIVTEDWRLSQFWYDQQTSLTVAHELDLLSRELASPVACVACPSLYLELKNSFSRFGAHLFEYDERFHRYGGDFTFYDYNSPEDVPPEHRHAYQVVVADPPYLSEECLRKTARTMKLLAKDEKSRLLLLTGAVQVDHALDMLGAHPCGFKPSHKKKLGNDFILFTNYDPQERLGGWEMR